MPPATRRPTITVPTGPRPAKPDYRHVFREPVYADGRPWHDPHTDGEDDTEDAHPTAPRGAL